MEQDIYVDILVFLNTVINFFLLLVTAALAGRERKTGRILAAAFFGGIYALILLLPQLNGPVLTLTRIAAAAIMTAVAFPFRSIRTFFISVWAIVSCRFFICRADGSDLDPFYAAVYALWKRCCLFSHPGNGISAGSAGCLWDCMVMHPPPTDAAGGKGTGAGSDRDRWQASFFMGGGRYRKSSVRSFQWVASGALPLSVHKGAVARAADSVF